MPLDGAAWADKASAFFTFLAGSSPLEVTPWDPETDTAAGDPVTFVHDERTRDLEAVEAGTLTDEELVIYTSSPLEEGETYRYLAESYTAEEVEIDRSAAADKTWPCRAVLRKHAS
jgi:hypothetical protein